MDGPIDPHDILKVRGEKELQRYLVDEIQEVYRLQGVNINDKHIEVIVRQMMRWMKVEDVGDTEFLIDEVVDKFRFRSENDKVAKGKKRGHRPSPAPRHHQGIALHRLVHLGGHLPGDHARPHRGRHQRQGGLPARPQGERHHGPPHPRRHGDGVLPQDQDPRRRSWSAGGRARGAATRPSTWSSPSTSRRAPRSSCLQHPRVVPGAARAARRRRPWLSGGAWSLCGRIAGGAAMRRIAAILAVAASVLGGYACQKPESPANVASSSKT
jgi:hypothetical protein